MISFERQHLGFILAMLVPAFLLLALFYIWPATFNLWNSFTDLTLLSMRQGGNFVGIQNYVDLIRDSGFKTVIWNTAFWLAFVSTLIRLLLGLGLALLIHSEPVRRAGLRTIARMAILLPWATPPIVAVVVWRQFFDGQGLFNQIFLDLGIISEPVAFLGNQATVWPALLMIITWNTLPVVTLTFLAALQTLPKDLFEAAEMDGAGTWRKFVDVTLPHLAPTMVVMGLLLVIWTFNNFVYVWLATGAGPGTFTNVLATEVFMKGFISFELGYSSAVGMIMVAIMLVFGAFYFHFVASRNFKEIM
ncbi:MAG: sugar ABC transporter permease [Roseibium sp.]|uniref:carbohydrate ABC transporter permease n=1 Tax=Roseibium sp. TaxID=1936156 RepID=UPI0026051B86|nr:sugar ABC transporter permease [Roseibium sp.]MCV0424152.1 sugar ABC transporter permease [Roseibium sp.]